MNQGVVVVGSGNVDYVMTMERLPRYGESVTDAEFTQTFGGKGANQAVAVARAGGGCTFIAAVGDDPNAEPMVKSWADAGVDTSRILHSRGVSCGSALILIDAKGGNYLSVAPGANYRLTPDVVEQHASVLGDAQYVILQYEIPAETISWVIDFASSHDVEVVWNFAPARHFPGNYESKVAYLIVNETEAGFLAGEDVADKGSAARCAGMLVDRGARHVVVTLGAAGSVLADQNQTVFLPAFSVEAVDTTAAGDVFCGALSVGLSEGMSFHDAGRFASAASALCVTRLGAQPSAPERPAIDEFLRERGSESLPHPVGQSRS